jgi:hypothetical protein
VTDEADELIAIQTTTIAALRAEIERLRDAPDLLEQLDGAKHLLAAKDAENERLRVLASASELLNHQIVSGHNSLDWLALTDEYAFWLETLSDLTNPPPPIQEKPFGERKEK